MTFSTKEYFFLVIGIIFSIFIGIFILELIFGAWIIQDAWYKTREINVVRNVRVTYDGSNIYGENSRPILYTRDQNGLRGSCTDPSKIDILTIGGSTTDQRYVSDGHTYQDILSELLTEKKGRVVCVSNAGIDGHSTFGHVRSFELWLPLIENLRPNYVLFYVGVNDAGFRNVEVPGYDNNQGTGFLAALRAKSAIYDFFRTLRDLIRTHMNTSIYAGHSLNIPPVSDYVVDKMTGGVEVKIMGNTRSFENRFRQLMAMTESLGAKPICVSQPHLMVRRIGGLERGIDNVFKYEGVSYNGLDYQASITSINSVMKKLCREHRGLFIDLASRPFFEDDFYDVVHTTPAGSKRIGGYIFDEFDRLGVEF